MKLNNKGITLVEIIISVALISIVLVFLFSLLIQVNNENADNEVRSSYLVNQSTFIKQIEEDFIEYKLKETSACSISNTGDTSKDLLVLPRLLNGTATIQKEGTEGNIKCLKFTYDNTSYDYAYLFLYKRDDTSTSVTGDYQTILSYYRGDFKQSVELEEFSWTDNYSVDSDKFDAKCTSSTPYITCTLPIIGSDYNDYSINLSYAS